jgi:23S rRNA pseudouridine2457 synthase
VRFRRQVVDAWLRLTIREGRNRQVRRMTAAVGLPTLRLIRVRIGEHELGPLAPGSSRVVAMKTRIPTRPPS